MRAGRSQQTAAAHIGKARSRMAELEDGRTTLMADELASLLDFYEVTGEERRTVVELGALTRTRQKRRAHLDLLPGSFQRFADLESSATERLEELAASAEESARLIRQIDEER